MKVKNYIMASSPKSNYYKQAWQEQIRALDRQTEIVSMQSDKVLMPNSRIKK